MKRKSWENLRIVANYLTSPPTNEEDIELIVNALHSETYGKSQSPKDIGRDEKMMYWRKMAKTWLLEAEILASGIEKL